MGSIAPAMGKESSTAKCHGKNQQPKNGSSCFQMPLHYPRYTKSDYESMPEWKLNCLLQEYGLPATGDVYYKRTFVMGAFLWSAH